MLFSCERAEIVPVSDVQQQELSAIIPGQYIVVLKDEGSLKSTGKMNYDARVSDVRALAAQMLPAAASEGRISQSYAKVLSGFAGTLTDEEVATLKSDDRVKDVRPDYVIYKKPTPPVDTTTNTQTTPWGISRVGSADGTGKVAWIIDTGVDYDHPDLNVDITRARTYVDRTSTADDDNGHGTHVAGTIAAKNNTIGVIGVAYNATVVPVKVLNKRGSGTYSGIIAGIDYVAATADPGDVANMSLGGPFDQTLNDAVLGLAEAGVLVALAAGNESQDAELVSPASTNHANIYTVSAFQTGDIWAYFSNFGSPVDVAAPGVSILSTYMGGGYATLSGTSMASPHVAGLLLITGGNLNYDGYVSGDPDGDPDPIGHK